MALLDLFKKKPKPAPAARVGRIESYNVADNVGVVRLESGEALRFGRSACQGFEPAEGVRVVVQATGPHPLGGERVQFMNRDPSDASYETRVAARDSSAAPPHPVPEAPVAPSHPIEADLLRRLDNIAAANTLVRGGQDPERLVLATNVDAEGRIDAVRPTMKFRFDVHRVGPDQWRLDAGIDDPVAYCKFTIDVALPENPRMDPASFDMANAPGFQVTFSKPPDHPRSPLARSAFLVAWRVDGGMDAPGIEAPLAVHATVMGVELTRLDYAYVPSRVPTEHWVLLKCQRGDQSFWLGLDLSTGVGEVFPRRGEVESYRLALDFLLTFS